MSKRDTPASMKFPESDDDFHALPWKPVQLPCELTRDSRTSIHVSDVSQRAGYPSLDARRTVDPETLLENSSQEYIDPHPH